MEQQVQELIKFLKQPEYTNKVRGGIAGSSMFEYFENQDIDLFLYDETGFRYFVQHIYEKCGNNDMFSMKDEKESFKVENLLFNSKDTYIKDNKMGLVTVKFLYNTCIELNITLKFGARTVFDVLKSFDTDIICKGYDIQSRQTLDLTYGAQDLRVASWNTWNPSYYNPKMWRVVMFLRQFPRVVKYEQRNCNMDKVVHKYIEMIDKLQLEKNIFESNKYGELLETVQKETLILKKEVFEPWLETKYITPGDLEDFIKKSKEL